MTTATAPAPSRLTAVALATPSAEVSRTRDPWFDNVRFVAAVLVVLGHVLTRVEDPTGAADALWAATWPFRIPVYVFVAGWFSARVLDRARSVALVRNVLVVYVVFDVLGAVQDRLADGTWNYDPFLPGMGLWFLLSLFCWRVLLPVLTPVRHLALWASAAAVLGGFVTTLGPEFSAARTVALFPIFVLGVQARDWDLRRRLTTARARGTAVVVAVLLLVGGAVVGADRPRSILLMRTPYSGPDQVLDAVARAGLLVAGLAGALTLFALVPRRRIPVVSYVGSGSMHVYLLHVFVIEQADESWGWFARVDSAPEVLLACTAAVGLALVLGSRPIRRVFRPLVQPRWRWPFDLGDQPSRRASTSATSP